MTRARRLVAGASLGLAIAVTATACDSSNGRPDATPQPTTASPSAVPTAIVKSTVTVTIRPPKAKLSADQQQVVSVFTEFVTARYRFLSHPWIHDPVYLRTVLPGGPDRPTDTGTIGLVGPLTIQVLAIDLSNSSTAAVKYCTDDRSVRYLGRDGTVDIAGPAGDHRRGGVGLEDTGFQLTLAAAADGKTSETPRWLAFKNTYLANAPECRNLTSSPPASPPPPRSPSA
jgi:hypothetical protein